MLSGLGKCGGEGYSATGTMYDIQLQLDQHLDPVFLDDSCVWFLDPIGKGDGKCFPDVIRIDLP